MYTVFGSILYLIFLQAITEKFPHTHRALSADLLCSFSLTCSTFLMYFKWMGLFFWYTEAFYFAYFICLAVESIELMFC